MEGDGEGYGGCSPLPAPAPPSCPVPPLSVELEVAVSSEAGPVAEGLAVGVPCVADGGESAEVRNPEPTEVSPMPVSTGESPLLPPFLDPEEAKEVAVEAADSGGLPAVESSASVPTDVSQKIVRQVEYYFSDENLPTDKFMLKYVKKNREGYVPIAVIASFRRMKKLVQDDALIAAALRTSSQLVVSADGKRVKRLHPLPAPEAEDRRPCTVLAENLPEDCSVESLQRTFGSSGEIRRISIRDPHSKEEPKISGKVHALVEYESPDAAERAVAILNDEKNWRSGMRVELLLKRMEKFGLISRARRPGAPPAEKTAGDGPAVGEGPGPEGPVEATGLEVGRRKQRGKGGQRGYAVGRGVEGPSKPPTGPRMPDGTRGFAMGRGRPPPPSPPP